MARASVGHGGQVQVTEMNRRVGDCARIWYVFPANGFDSTLRSEVKPVRDPSDRSIPMAVGGKAFRVGDPGAEALTVQSIALSPPTAPLPVDAAPWVKESLLRPKMNVPC